MAATIFFGSNTTINGTNGDDSMVGNDTSGNVNDLVYGHQGNDTITFDGSVSRSTIFGGQGADSISVFNGGQNQIYGNLGNDTILSEDDTGDTIFGGQGNDLIFAITVRSGAIYGNMGNDTLIGHNDALTNFFGGQGDDAIVDSGSNLDAIYGNQGNDLLIGEGITNSHMFGGQGNDTLVFTGFRTINDTMTGNLGNDLFIATNGAGDDSAGNGFPISADEIVTVTDFLSGNDHLALTSSNAAIPLVKIGGTGDNAVQALEAANDAFASNAGGSEYVFVYGGVGTGYLFYNGDHGSSNPITLGHAATAGLALVGATGENSVMSSDITTIPSNVPA
jgi:Ca2+-binding RTX toxin-like protein